MDSQSLSINDTKGKREKTKYIDLWRNVIGSLQAWGPDSLVYCKYFIAFVYTVVMNLV